MGAETFRVEIQETDVEKAFREAVENAQYEYGHGGYTGTIAEKDDYVVVSTDPLGFNEAQALAERLIRAQDARIDDKWGPAGAIPLLDGARTVKVAIPEIPDGYATLEDAARAGLAQCSLRPGERMVRVAGAQVETTDKRYPRDRARIKSGWANVVVDGGEPLHWGWMFFGWASS